MGHCGALTEVIFTDSLASNSNFLMNMISGFMRDNRWLAWIEPPKQVKKSDFFTLGKDSGKVLSLKSDNKFSSYDLALRALNAGTCQTVIINANDLSSSQLEKLERAAERSNSIALVMRTRN